MHDSLKLLPSIVESGQVKKKKWHCVESLICDLWFQTVVLGILSEPQWHLLVFWRLTSSSASQVARAGRFGTKGLAVTFVSDETDAKTLTEVQDRFEVNVTELPEEIVISSYSKFSWH